MYTVFYSFKYLFKLVCWCLCSIVLQQSRMFEQFSLVVRLVMKNVVISITFIWLKNNFPRLLNWYFNIFRKDFKGYSLESRLHFRVHAAKLQLKTMQNLDDESDNSIVDSPSNATPGYCDLTPTPPLSPTRITMHLWLGP